MPRRTRPTNNLRIRSRYTLAVPTYLRANRLPSPKALKALSVVLAIPYVLALYQLLIVPRVPTFDQVRPVNLIPGWGLVHLLIGVGGVQHKAFVILGNAFIFVPLGMLLGLWLSRANQISMLVIAVLVPAAFETYQYLAPTWRTADIDSAIVGALGCYLAAIATRRVAGAIARNRTTTNTWPNNAKWPKRLQ